MLSKKLSLLREVLARRASKAARLAAALVAVVAICPAFAKADSITIGTANSLGSGTFNNAGANTRYQQVYGKDAFSSVSGPIAITSLTFFAEAWDYFFRPIPVEEQSIATGTYIIRLSTTSAPVDGLAANFDNNLGADVATFYSGVLSNTLTISGVTPFIYDPSMGNLLLDVQIVSQTPNNGLLHVHLDNYTLFHSSPPVRDQMSNRIGPGSYAITTGEPWTRTGGYVTKFEYTTPTATAVPAPASILLFGTGILAFAAFRRGRTSA